MESALFTGRLRTRIKADGLNGEIRTNADGTRTWTPRVDQTPAQITSAENLIATTDEAVLLLWESAQERIKDTQRVDDRIQKAGWLVTMDENNLQTDKVNAILAAIKGAATFAAMKTAVTAIANYPQRNATQVRTSIINKIQSGAAD